MMNLTGLVDRYVAVWNEADANERRKRIRSLWAPDGTTCNRLQEACGYEAIEARVAGSWDKWIREGKYRFRPMKSDSHHEIIKFDWMMEKVPAGEVDSTGVSFLVLDSSGVIQHDYQFSASANDAQEVSEKYFAIWNEPKKDKRRQKIGDLWAADCVYQNDVSMKRGCEALEAEVFEMYKTCAAKELSFSPGGLSQVHHNVAKLSWTMQGNGQKYATSSGSDFLILNEDGYVRLGCRFDDEA